MKALKVEDIPDQGLSLDEPLGIDFLNEVLPQSQDFAPQHAGVTKLFLQRQGQNVVIKGSATADVRCVCASCLKDLSLHLQPNIDIVLFKNEAEKKPVDKDGGLSVEAFDDEPIEGEGAGEYDGKTVDWPALVREHLMLALPLAPRCKDDCKGLCPVCGINRNDAQCQCVTKQVDPRWEKLKLLKLKLPENSGN